MRSQLGVLLQHPQASLHLVLASSALLIGLGVMMVLSASSVYAANRYDDAFYFLKRQAFFLVVGLLAAFVLARLPIAKLRIVGWIGMGLAFLLLILTYTPLGVTVNGNRNWLSLGIDLFRIQPSEFAKLALIVWGADVFCRKRRLLDQPRHLLVPFLPAALLLLGLVVFQGDLGTAMIMIAIIAVMLWGVGTPMRLMLAMAAAAVAAVIPMTLLSADRMRRFSAFFNPAEGLDGANMQSTMALYAIASGSWWGTGIGGSRQKWGSLPEAHNDFIFAVIAEELGLLGGLVVLALFAVLTYAGLRIAIRSDIDFCRYAATGVTAWFSVQALINLGVVLRLLPVLGVPLPMVSYGGSALLANLCALGVLVACARNEPGARALREARRGPRRPRVTTLVGGRR
nr:putative lipid II flippase FtsW [Naumannella cuiyingiana]